MERRAIVLCMLCAVMLMLPVTRSDSPFGVCLNSDEDCPECPRSGEFGLNSHKWLKSYKEISDTMKKAQALVKTISPDKIKKFDAPEIFHMTVNYFCCHMPWTYVTIGEALLKHNWTAFNLTYQSYSCNIDHNNETVYIHANLDEPSEARMMEWIRGTEQAVRDKGVNVTHPRSQPFHFTLGRVMMDYPVKEALDRLNSDPELLTLGSLRFQEFEFMDLSVRASDYKDEARDDDHDHAALERRPAVMV